MIHTDEHIFWTDIQYMYTGYTCELGETTISKKKVSSWFFPSFFLWIFFVFGRLNLHKLSTPFCDMDFMGLDAGGHILIFFCEGRLNM